MSEDTATPDAEPEVAGSQEGVDIGPTETQHEPHEAPEGVDGETGDQPEGEAEGEAEAEEIEFDGIKATVPKALAQAIAQGALKAKDYTQKTQAVAEERRALESREAEITQRAEFQKANLADFAKLHVIDTDLAAYQAFTQEQWDALKAADIDKYREHKDAFRDLKDERESLAKTLATKETEANQAREKEASEALSTSRKAMADVLTGRAKTESGHDLTIPNLDADRLGKIGKFAAEAYGVTGAELATITDARILKALDEARLYRLGLTKAKQVARVEDAQRTTPARAVGGAAPNARKPTDASGDGLSADEWMKRRNQEEAARRAKR